MPLVLQPVINQISFKWYIVAFGFIPGYIFALEMRLLHLV